MTPYRSDRHAIRAAMEEQAEALVWTSDAARRKRRVLGLVAALPLGVLLLSCAIAPRPAPPSVHCRHVEVRHEGFGGVLRPPDTWTACSVDGPASMSLR